MSIPTVDSDICLVIIAAGGSSWRFHVCGVVRRTHELSRDEWRQEVDASVGRHQGGNCGGDHVVG